MEGLASLLLFAALFYFMMRFGCGAHMVHGHGGGGHRGHADHVDHSGHRESARPMMEEEWLLPIGAVLLPVPLATLAWTAKARHDYRVAFAGFVGSVAILVGKFALDSSVGVYGGIAILAGVSIWNAWPRRPAAAASCARCGQQT